MDSINVYCTTSIGLRWESHENGGNTLSIGEGPSVESMFNYHSTQNIVYDIGLFINNYI